MELISREKVLNILNNKCNHALKVYDKKYHLPIRTITLTAIEDIKILPSQTYNEVKSFENRPKGKWIKESDYKVMGDGYMWDCSECGNRVYVDSGGLFPNYCEDCGADMRGNEE